MNQLFLYENDLLEKGIEYIAGVDEVGRGPLAGPMVVCSVILDIKSIYNLEINDIGNQILSSYREINDSKKLSQKKREFLDIFIRNVSIDYSLIEITNEELDELGITESTQKAFFSAVMGHRIKAQHVLTDTFPIKKLTESDQTNIVKGDSKSISIAAASIVAKVHRDRIMRDMHTLYPQYGFDVHKGYGTRKHIEALNKYGPCKIHRKSFEPVRSLVNR